MYFLEYGKLGMTLYLGMRCHLYKRFSFVHPWSETTLFFVDGPMTRGNFRDRGGEGELVVFFFFFFLYMHFGLYKG